MHHPALSSVHLWVWVFLRLLQGFPLCAPPFTPPLNPPLASSPGTRIGCPHPRSPLCADLYMQLPSSPSSSKVKSRWPFSQPSFPTGLTSTQLTGALNASRTAHTK